MKRLRFWLLRKLAGRDYAIHQGKGNQIAVSNSTAVYTISSGACISYTSANTWDVD